MAIEYSLWVFEADPLMEKYDSPGFKSQTEFIRSKLNELGKEGWRVVGQSVLPVVESGFGMDRDEKQEVRTTLRLVYTLAKE